MTGLVLALLLAADEPSEPVSGTGTGTGPGLGLEALGLVYLRRDPIDGGLLGGPTLGGLATLDAEAALGPIFSPDSGLRLAAELLVVRVAWGGDEGTDALSVSQTSWITSPRLRVGWALGERLQLQPFFSVGPAATFSSVSYRIADPAIEGAVEEVHAGVLPGLTGAVGVLASYPLSDLLLPLARLEGDVVRRGGTTDLAFGLGLGLQFGHVTPPAPRPR